VYFAHARGVRRAKREMANALAELVRTNADRIERFQSFGPPDLPDGLVHVGIASGSGNWWTGEGGTVSLSDIWESLEYAISGKNKLVGRYRQKLAPEAQVWLLLYTTASISRALPIPQGIEDRTFNFDFDRVFWFASFEGRFAEIRKQARTVSATE
jgi:hypothetical protein